MFGFGKIPLVSDELVYYLKSYFVPLYLGVLGATPLVKNKVNELSKGEITGKIINVLEPVFLVGLVVVVTAFLVDGSFNPFLYFRF